MNTKELKVPIAKSRRGHPVMWEEGGGATNTGDATIICDVDGSPLTPIFIATRGHLACGQHALFVIKVGYPVVKVYRHRKSVETVVYVITSISNEEATLDPICIYSDETEWMHKPDWEIMGLQGGPIHDAIREAIGKTSCYHCREPHYIKAAE